MFITRSLFQSEFYHDRRKLDNWGVALARSIIGGGANIHIFVFCTINFF